MCTIGIVLLYCNKYKVSLKTVITKPLKVSLHINETKLLVNIVILLNCIEMQ